MKWAGTVGTQEGEHWGWFCSPLGCQAEPQNSAGPTPSPHPNVPGPGPWNKEEPFQPVLPKYCGGLLVPLHGDSTPSWMCSDTHRCCSVPATLQETGVASAL